jgi:serine/threonine-protein kinase
MEGQETTVSQPNHDDLIGSTIGRFVVRTRIGAGGMGEVYRADDPQLKRTVAIKRLLPAARSSREQLLKEAQRASALNHPRIASVYDVFEVDDEMFLVMEFVHGETLRDRLASSPLSVDQFEVVAAQCVDGLAAAHGANILHGDLKPANIMLTRAGDVKICDFGLARRLPRPGGVGDSTITAPRALVGTPAYMSPEVIFERPTDGRADIFSLGIVFYEALAGRHPFLADGAIATIDRILNDTPEALERVSPDVPPRLARLVHRMFERSLEKRPASMADIGRELASIREDRATYERRRGRRRRVAILSGVAALVAVLVLGVPRLEQWMPHAPAGAAIPSNIQLAVLPFMAPGDVGRQFFVDGLVQSLNSRLSRLTVNRPLQVASAADVRTRGVTNAKEAREQLGSNVALSGSLRYSGNSLEIICQLLDTRSGDILRAETITADPSNPLAAEDRIMEAVIRMLDLTLSETERTAIVAHDTAQPGAYDYYLQAKGYLSTYDRLENVDNAITVFRKALDIDARYALAYAGLGEAYWQKHELTGSSAWVEPARAACEGALGIDPNVAEPHACLGMVLAGTGEYEKAAAQYALALQREPTDDELYLGLATAYEKLGRPGDAEQAYRRAIQLRPQYWGAYNMLGAYYYRAARYDDALAMFQQVVALTPDSYRGYSSIGAIHFMKDEIPDAIAAFQKSLSIRPNYNAASNLGTLYYYEGDFRRSAEQYRQAVSIDQSSYQVWANLASALSLSGAADEAKAAYRKARDLVRERADVNPRDASLRVALADSEAALGDMDAARADLDRALTLSPTDAHTLFVIAVFYEQRLQQREAALTWLSRAIARGQTWREIDHLPTLRDLRKDPRFKKLRSTA